MARSAVVELLIRLKDEASKELANVDKNLDKFQKNLKATSMTMLKVGGTMATAAFFPIKQAADFERTMSQVNAVMFGTKAGTEETAEAFASLEAIARKMGAETKFTAQQSAEALTFLAMAGLNAQESIKALPGTLELAAAGNIGLAEAADLATNVMSGMRLPVEDLTRVNDNLAYVASNANANVLELAEAMKIAGPAAAATGTSMEEVMSVLGAMADNGIKASSAGNNVKRMLLALTAPTDKAKAALETMSVSTVDSEGNFRGLREVLDDVGSALDEMPDQSQGLALMSDIFGRYAATAAAAAASSSEKMKELSDALKIVEDGTRAAEGAAGHMAKVMQDNLSGAVVTAMSAIQELILVAAMPLMETLQNLVERGTAVIRWAQAFLKSIGPVGPTILLMVGVVGALLTVLGLLGLALNLTITGLRGLATAALWTATTAIPKLITNLKLTIAHLNTTSVSSLLAAKSIRTLAGAMALLNTALGVLGAAFAGWELGQWINGIEIGTLTVQDHLEKFITWVETLVTKMGITLLKGKRAFNEFFGLSTEEVDAAIQRKEWHLEFLDQHIAEIDQRGKKRAENAASEEARITDITESASAERLLKAEEYAQYMAYIQKGEYEVAEKYMRARIAAASLAAGEEVDAEESALLRKKTLREGFIREFGEEEEQATQKLREEYDERLKSLKTMFEQMLSLEEAGSAEYLALKAQQAAEEEELKRELEGNLQLIAQESRDNQLEGERLVLAQKRAYMEADVAEGLEVRERGNARLLAEELKFAERVVKAKEGNLKTAIEFYGKDSEEYRTALGERTVAEQAFTETLKQEKAARVALTVKNETDELEFLKTKLQQRFVEIEKYEALGVYTAEQANAEKLRAEEQYVKASRPLHDAKFQAIAANYDKDSEEYKTALAEKLKAEQEYWASIRALQQQQVDMVRQQVGTQNEVSDATGSTGEKIEANTAKQRNINRLKEEENQKIAEKNAKLKESNKKAQMHVDLLSIILNMYSSAIDKAGQISSALVAATGAAASFWKGSADQWLETNKLATDVVYSLEAQKKAAIETARALEMSWPALTGMKFIYNDIEAMHRTIARGLDQQIELEKEIQVLTRARAGDTGAVHKAQSMLTGSLEQYNLLSGESVARLRQVRYELQDQLNTQRRINAEKDGGVTISKIEEQLQAARNAGLDIEAYGFDKQSADRLKVLETESKEIDAQIKNLRYKSYLELQALEEKGAKQEEVDKAREEYERQIQELENERQGGSLEADALKSKLDLEVLNLKIVNDLKIKHWEEELVREQQAHEERMKHIEAENELKLKAIASATGADNTTLGFSRGGQIPGGDSKIDSVKVLARPGEWFIRNEAVKDWTRRFGSGFMSAINNPWSSTGQRLKSALSGVSQRIVAMPTPPKRHFSTGGMVQRFAEGGQVAAPQKTHRVQFVSPSGNQVTGYFEDDVSKVLNVILEAGGRTT